MKRHKIRLQVITEGDHCHDDCRFFEVEEWYRTFHCGLFGESLETDAEDERGNPLLRRAETCLRTFKDEAPK